VSVGIPLQGLGLRGIYPLAKTKISSTDLIWIFVV
jgi:hypothetical protein